MSDQKINILLVEDNPADAKFIEIMLREVGPQFNLTNVATFAEGMEILRTKEVDLILLDLSLPDSFGMDTVKNANLNAGSVPIIVLTGRNDEEFALDVVKAGAQDYLIKGAIDSGLLSKSIRYSIQRKQLEANLQQKNTELLRVNKTLDRFVYIISHDLKKPVANIIGLLSLFDRELNNNLSEKGQVIYKKINSSVGNLKQMMEDLLESTRQEIASSQNYEPVALAKLFETVKTNIDQLIQTNQAVVHSEFNVSTILYPQQDLKSILHNLLSNAVIYHSKQRTPEIWIRTEMTFKGPVMTVRDNGRGMDLAEIGDKLFKKYERFNKDIDGTGVGLWLVKEIIEKNGGHISVESKPEEGTSFKITFNTTS